MALKLDTLATSLSGGQKQRLNIARAIVANPTILLLDEATAALDTKSEKNVQKALNNLMEGKTVIAIAHRLSTIMDSNKICVIDEQTIVEEGTHVGLLRKEGGKYAELCKLSGMSGGGGGGDKPVPSVGIRSAIDNIELGKSWCGWWGWWGWDLSIINAV